MKLLHSRRRAALLSTIAVAAFSAGAFSQSTTVVLQNGLAGYTGFKDTYIESTSLPVARGSDTLLQSWCG